MSKMIADFPCLPRFQRVLAEPLDLKLVPFVRHTEWQWQRNYQFHKFLTGSGAAMTHYNLPSAKRTNH